MKKLLVQDKVYLFDKNSDKFKTWKEKIDDWDKKTKKVLQFSADLLGINEKPLEYSFCIATNGTVLINHKLAEKNGLGNKIKVLASSEFAIKNEDGEYLGQWASFKTSLKEYKQIENYKSMIGLNSFGPDIKEHFLNVSRFDNMKAKRLLLEDYGMFLVIDISCIDKDMEKAFENAKEMKMSEFYKFLEDLDGEKE